MENLGTDKDAVKAEDQEAGDKAIGRFRPTNYVEEYAPSWTNTFRHRTELLWTIIMADRKHRNEPSWAQCCYTLERKKAKGLLGHPKESLVPIGRLFAQEQINNLDTFHQYIEANLPKNLNRDPRLPQVNMKHGVKVEGSRNATESPRKTTCNCNPEAIDSKLLGLEAMVDDLTTKNTELLGEIRELKTTLQVHRSNQAADDAYQEMDKRFDTLDGRVAVFLLHQQKQARMIEMAEQTRQEANLKQTEHCFELRSMIEKLTDRFNALEESMTIKTQNKSLQSEEGSRKYDPEMLDQYTLNWKSLSENYGTYHSPMSQLKGLKKRAPGDK